MKFLVVLIAFTFLTVTARSIPDDDKSPSNGVPYNEELIVESSLNVRPKNHESLGRKKRQFGNFGQSSAQAQANAFNQQFGPNGFGASNALAGAQSFNSQGPLGGFGASAANSASQGFNAGPGGFGANSAFTGSQSYNLPGNHQVGISYGNTYANNNGQASNAQTSGITYS